MNHTLERYSTTLSSPPGRVVSYLNNQDKLDPVSCRLIWWEPTRPQEFFTKLFYYLSRGAGVKVILDHYTPLPPVTGEVVFTLDKNHQDFPLFEQENNNNNTKQQGKSYLLLTVQDDLADIANVCGVLYNHLLEDVSVEIDLSLLRPAGTTNQHGLVASGPVSFMKVYKAIHTYLTCPCLKHFLTLLGTINEVVRRGGIYKNGIITTEMIDTHPSIEEYLSVPKVELPGSHSKGVTLTKEPTGKFLTTITELRNTESLFLSKLHKDPSLRPNVCMGLFLPPDGTCLIWRVNLGQAVTPQDLVKGFTSATESLVLLHHKWNRTNLDIPVHLDRQVGLCVMGLSNLLTNQGITYRQFIGGLSQFLTNGSCADPKVQVWVAALAEAYSKSTELADYLCEFWGLPQLNRIHTVEPGQSHPYRCKDANGVTVTRGLYPPLTNRVIRRSDTMPGIYTYPGHETIRDSLSKQDIYQLHTLWFRLMKLYGRPHAISYDTYHPQTEDDILEWYRGPLPTCYYHKGGDLVSAKQTTKVDLGVVCSIDKAEGCQVCGGD